MTDSQPAARPGTRRRLRPASLFVAAVGYAALGLFLMVR